MLDVELNRVHQNIELQSNCYIYYAMAPYLNAGYFDPYCVQPIGQEIFMWLQLAKEIKNNNSPPPPCYVILSLKTLLGILYKRRTNTFD